MQRWMKLVLVGQMVLAGVAFAQQPGAGQESAPAVPEQPQQAPPDAASQEPAEDAPVSSSSQDEGSAASEEQSSSEVAAPTSAPAPGAVESPAPAQEAVPPDAKPTPGDAAAEAQPDPAGEQAPAEVSAGKASVPEHGDVADIADVSLDDLLNAQTTVASKSKRTIRNAPGVVTIISRREIVRSGARDLIDVLRMVPGFELNVDVQGVTGLGFRGVWGHEGKILLLMDGQELNERSYSTLQIGNHYSTEWIERVEVVRGPGSVIYGGYGELAVINIVTRKAAEIKGASLSGHYQAMGRTFGQRAFSLSAGDTFEDASVVVHLFAGQGNRSDRTYTDIYGDSFGMAKSSSMDPLGLNVGIDYGDLSLRFIYDDFRITTRDLFDAVADKAIPVGFPTYIGDAQYTWKLSDKLTVVPRLHYTRQRPWLQPDVNLDAYDETTLHQVTLGATAKYQPSPELALNVGVEGYYERADYPANDGSELPSEIAPGCRALTDGPALDCGFENITGFVEALADLDVASIMGGARYEYHSVFGSSFVPRLALTKQMGGLHLKALASQAFRAPGFANLRLNPDLTPESTTVFEVEAGYRLTDYLFVSANLFDITVNHPIIYFYDEATDEEGYRNYKRTGSSGGELELRFSQGPNWVTLSYAYYTPRFGLFGPHKNTVATYDVDGHPALLGFAPHKGALSGNYQPLPNLNLNVSATLYSARYGYAALDAADNPVLKRFNPIFLLNAFVLYENLFLPGLSLGAGVYDIADRKSHVFLQPYNNYHAPYPMPSRELVMRVSYKVDF